MLVGKRSKFAAGAATGRPASPHGLRPVLSPTTNSFMWSATCWSICFSSVARIFNSAKPSLEVISVISRLLSETCVELE